jgi:glycosyltransferase involved in cell wall biosynthesis
MILNLLVSIIVCTHNRSRFLEDCLDSLIEQSYGNIEIIIVKSVSPDESDEILKSPIFKVITQKCDLGLSNARNLGLRASIGEIVAFIDDDAIADKDWVKELAMTYGKNTACVGGVIKPVWPGDKPDWYCMEGSIIFDNYLSILDYGHKRRLLHYPEYPFGCNISFRRKALIDIGGFDESLGRKNHQLLSNEEIDVCRALENEGYEIEYSPYAIVYHQINPSRLNKDFFKKRSYWQGFSDAIIDNKYLSRKKLIRRTLKTMYGIPGLAIHSLNSYPESLIHQLEIFKAAGYVFGVMMRQLKSSRTGRDEKIEP